MNKALIIFFSGLGTASLLLGTSYAVYDNISIKEKLITSLELGLVKNIDDTNISYTIPLEDDSAKRPTTKFILKNNSGVKGKYRLLLQETPINTIDDGCKVEDLMSKDILKYELLKNNKSIKKGYLKDLPASILFESSIKEATTEEFELKTWIPLETKTWMGKHFHYRISISAII
ncbi:MAG: hypothetical protein RR359_04275 [Bacilli bacterium]